MKGDSMPDRPQSISQPPNAFRPTFLRVLAGEDGSLTAADAEYSGPWKVEPLDGRFAVFRTWEDPSQGDPAFAVLNHPETASILAAVLPSIGREPLFHLDPDGARGAFRLTATYGERGPVEAGVLSVFEPAVVTALHVVEYLTRTPLALAAVLLASGPGAIEDVGRILCHRIEGGEPPPLEPAA
jgi:hypothetical protein